MWNHNFNIKDYINPNRQLIAYTFPGGYPLYYILNDHNAACWRCANQDKKSVIQADVNYENTDLYCDECDTNIECAYYPTC